MQDLFRSLGHSGSVIENEMCTTTGKHTMSDKLLVPGRCFIIAEVAQAHDGSLGMAHAFIDAIAKSGADAVKFQTHFADAESSSLEQFRVRFSKQDATRYDYWKRMEFTEDQWVGLAHHAQERGLVFLSTSFSMRAFELLERIGIRGVEGRVRRDRQCSDARPYGCNR